VSSSDGIGKLRAIERQFDRDRISVADLKSLEDIRTRYLSRKAGLLTLELQSLGKLPKDQRAEFGRVANEVKLRIEAALDTLQATIADREKQTAPRTRQYGPITKIYSFPWSTRSRPAPRSKPYTTISPRSISRPTIRRASLAIPATSPNT